MWSNDATLNIISSCVYWIECSVSYGDRSFLFTGVYGPPILRHILWNQLKNFNANDLPWIICRDFNQILNKLDKLSKYNTSRGSQELINAIKDRALFELSNSGDWYTWTNNRHEDNVVWERLNCCLCNTEWLTLWPHTIFHNYSSNGCIRPGHNHHQLT